MAAPPAFAAPTGITEPNRDATAAATAVPVPATPSAERPALTGGPKAEQTSAVEKAQADARKQGSPVVVDALTTDRSQTTAQPDGTLETQVSVGPVRFRDPAG